MLRLKIFGERILEGAHFAAALAVWIAFVASSPAAEPIRITHGPILGRIDTHQIGVWVRTSRAGSFEVHCVERLADSLRVKASGTTRLEADNTGWVLLRDLKGNTHYDYWVVPEGREAGQPGGSFRTLPDSAEVHDAITNPRSLFNFSFEFGCGNFQRPGQRGKESIPVFATLMRTHGDELNFTIQNGDWIYEDFRRYRVEEWRDQLGIAESQIPEVLRNVPQLAGVWENYKAYLQRCDELSAMHARLPAFFTFDDHEIVDDCAGAGSIGSRPRRALFRDIALRGWYDYVGWANPVATQQDILLGRVKLRPGDVLEDPRADFTRLKLEEAGELHVHWGGPDAGEKDKKYDNTGGDPNAGVYRIVKVLDANRLRIDPPLRHESNSSYSVGRQSYYRQRIANCDFFFLDTRGHRELPVLGKPMADGISMLGQRQKAWLKQGMAASDADCFFVISSVNFMVPHMVDVGTPDFVGYDDAWTAFGRERDELLEFFDGLKKQVFVLTGDLHNSFVVKMTDRVWEMASGPRSSGNATAASEGDRPPNGPFDSLGRPCFIRWSTWFDNALARREYPQKVYCVVSIKNVFKNGAADKALRWQAYPHPLVMFQYHDGLTGRLLYAESIVLNDPKP